MMVSQSTPTSHCTLVAKDERVGLLSVATGMLWIGCLAIGIAGIKLHYPWPTPPKKSLDAIEARTIQVQVTNDPSPLPEIGSSGPPPAAVQPQMQPPAPPEAAVAPASPPLAAVATPSPAIAFAVPVEGPTRIVAAKQAIPARADTAPATASSEALARPSTGVQPSSAATPRQITFGEGEGKQPAPEYPREAVIARQQGTVVVRFTVGEDGRVLEASASKPSPYALLNQAAVRKIREAWRFAKGPKRVLEVSIEYELKQK
jgi:TonB family protein